MTADQIIEELKTALISTTTNAVMGVITSAVPAFLLPGLNQVTRLAVEYVISVAVRYTELGAYFVYVDSYTKAEAEKFKAAVAARANAKTDAERLLAEQRIVDAARNFIRLGK